MRTILTSVALAACAAVQAQNAASIPPQDTVQHVQSIYDECLLTAGTSSWRALGLNDDQIIRLSELQSRYKDSAKAADAKAAADTKASAKATGKNKAESKVKTEAKEAPVATRAEKSEGEDVAVEQPDGKQVDPNMEPTLNDSATAEVPVDAHGTLDKEDDFSAATAPAVEYSALDTELRAILTPAQLAQWERRCDNRTSFKP